MIPYVDRTSNIDMQTPKTKPGLLTVRNFHHREHRGHRGHREAEITGDTRRLELLARINAAVPSVYEISLCPLW